MRVIDLSHLIKSDMPVYPGTEPPSFSETATLQRDGYRERLLSMWSHTGTHMDAPAHLLKDAPTLDRLPVGTFIGRAVCLRCRGRGDTIGEALVREYVAIGSDVDFVLLDTGWSEKWGTDSYFRGYPVLSPGAARCLVGAGVRGVGVDAISVDPVGASELPVHRILLGAGLVLVENLKHLELLPDEPFLFSCLPLKLVDADGSPVRAAAILL